MPQIKILPENLSNKIAAGEVVERPASVVKELVENALDAGSDRIVIEVEKGGRSLIQVSDNGAGMSPDDALLSIERYATSKIYTDDDLFSINTLGFRGEALPSIASVSRFTLVTRQKDADAGTEIIISGGKIVHVSETGAPTGTMVAVKQLFYNTPARRKFLKSITTEMGHIVETVAGIALGWPDVRFRLIHNGRTVKNWAGVSSDVDRVVDVLGRDLENNLYELSYESDRVSLTGWVSSPAFCRSTSRGIYIYVNGRIVKDKVILHALFQGYAGRIVKGQFPLAVLFLRVPGKRVDVNVHPAKSEVRFADQKMVHDSVQNCVTRTLQRSDRASWSTGYKRPDNAPYAADAISEKVSNAYAPTGKASQLQWRITGPESDAVPFLGQPATDDGPSRPHMHQLKQTTPPPEQEMLWKKKRFSDLVYVGQFHDTYLLFESDEGLIVIDQHAAHERIVYEQFKQRSSSEIAKQALLIPETVDLNFREAAAIETILADLNTLGFEVEPFGGGTYVIKAVPAVFANRQIAPMIREMLDTILETGNDGALAEALDDCIKIMACHSAIRANQKMKTAEITVMLKQLDACENPSNCPHGRPTWINWPVSFLEKAFKRVL